MITDGGDQPNVVPARATVWYYFRETDYPHIKEMWDFGNKMAEGAGLMTSTTWTSQLVGTAWPQHFNKPVAEAMYANAQRVGLPQWSDDDQRLAKAVQREVGSTNTNGLDTMLRPLQGPVRDEDKRGAGSDDIGDVSWTVPTITLRYPANIPGLPGHNWSSAVASATPIAHKGVVAGAKVQAMTILDLLTTPGAGQGGVGLLQRRPDQGREVHAVPGPDDAAADVDEQGDAGAVPARAAEVLLRPDAVQAPTSSSSASRTRRSRREK